MKKQGKIRFAVVAAALSLVAASCGTDPVLDAGSAGGGNDAVTTAAAGGDETTTTTAEETTTTEEETTTTVEERSDQAQSFRTLITQIDDLDPDVLFFFDQASDARIDELGDSACSQINPDQTTTELGAVAISSYTDLPPDEKALLDLGQFSTAFGTLAGFYCPENLPGGIGGDDGSTAMPDPESIDRDIQGYRDNIDEFLDPGHEAIGFVANASDGRVNELVDIACNNASPDQTTNELGFDVLDVYSNDLTDAESDSITVTSFAELYGTFLGWFCPEAIPSGG